jgi:hypothetical protein
MRAHSAPAGRPSEVAPAWPSASPQAVPAPALHTGLLDGATVTGEASRRHLAIRVGLWLDDAGAVRKARWRGDADDALRACAESACGLLEAGTDPRQIDGAALRTTLLAASAAAEDAELVASAIEAALLANGPFGAG